MSDHKQLRYVDHRPITISLKLYRGSIGLPNKDNVIKVTDAEYRTLIKRTNGRAPCFVPVEPASPRRNRATSQED